MTKVAVASGATDLRDRYSRVRALSLALGGDPIWRPFYLEGYFFIAAVYGVMCFGLSRYGRWIERRLNRKPD